MITFRNRLLSTAVVLLAGAAFAVGAQSASAEPAPAAPSVTVSPASGLDPGGDTVTVTGTGFSTEGAGIYVALAARSHYSSTNADAFGATKWVHVGATPSAGQDVLDADGSFTTTLDVAAVFGSGENATDCTTTQCAVFTLAAHGSPDRSQDTATDVVFGDTPPSGVNTPTEGNGTPDRPSAARASLSRSTVAPGAGTVVTATGFAPGEQVQAVLHSAPVNLGISPADSTGRYRLAFTVPADMAVGAHTLVLTGLASGQVVRVPLTVAADVAVNGVGDDGASGVTGGEVPAAGSGELAATGAQTASLLVLAVGLLAAGGALLVVLRSPRRARLH